MLNLFLAYLKKKGLKLTSQRRSIFDVFVSVRRHASAEELYALMKISNPSIGQATVFRSMKLLVDAGIAQSSDLGGRKLYYEPNRRHHDHLICTHCGIVKEFQSEAIEREQEKVAMNNGFLLEAHRMELFGCCQACSRKRDV